MTRPLAALAWLILFAVPWLGPSVRPDAGAWVVDLLTGQWSETEPWVVVHFQLMGVWPMLIGLQLRHYWLGRPMPAAPFCLASFGVGAYGLLPWFVLRGATPGTRATPRLDRFVPWIAGGLGVTTLGLLGFGLLAGRPAAWLHAARTDGFIWTMAADFAVLWATSAWVAREAGRGRWWWAIAPVLGTIALMAEPSPPHHTPET
ncbi:MAG: hypothetical protein CL927_13995 [Deltaproteobacteria bacterium]|nr:hypothetical protein [Deltaproteobacteria bacterium]HCH65893.1 hypothetical protein [Deltaproteobacteria bacterium]